MRTSSDDPLALDDGGLDALLDGRLGVDDAPAAYRPIAMVLRAADAPAHADEAAPRPDAIRRIFEEARQGPSPAPRPRPVDGRRAVGRWSVRAAVVAIAAMFTAGWGVAMAATGTLPGPLQPAAARVLEVVGIEVPDGDDADPSPPGDPAVAPPSSTTTTVTTAPPTTAVPEPAITQPTTTPTVAAEPPPSTSVDPREVPGQGDEVCEEASDGQCRAGEPNPSDSRPSRPDDAGPPTTVQNPSVTAPGRTGDSPSETRPSSPGRP